MSSDQVGGTLVGKGSFGCVFNPSLKCPGENINSDELVSKVFFGNNSKAELNDEFKVNKIIKSIHGYEEWAEIWYKKCKPPPYTELLKQDPEIEDCLYDNDISEKTFNKNRLMLQGKFAGVTLIDFMSNLFNKSIFSSNDNFVRSFLLVMTLMKPLFTGLKEMYKKNISHNDIKDDNIMITLEHKCSFIDFGLATEFSNKRFYEQRSKLEFISDRIYPPYPYEFIYLFSTSELLEEYDLNDIKLKVPRSLHDRYVYIHEKIFGRKVSTYLLSLIYKLRKIKYKKSEYDNIVSLLDTYSIGVVIPHILYKIAKRHGTLKQLSKLVKLNKVKSFIDLFRSMSEPDNNNRITPSEALDKFTELERLYLI